jgi:hypothetical protein
MTATRRLILVVALAACGLGAGSTLTTAPALAEFEFEPGSAGFSFSFNEAPSASQLATDPQALGAPEVQAGSHPWALRSSFRFNPTGLDPVRDVQVELPAGFVGNPSVIAGCTAQQFTTPARTGFANAEGRLSRSDTAYEVSGASCPPNTEVGVAEVELQENSPQYFPVYSLVPPPGVPAELGFNATGLPVILQVKARTGGDDGLTVDARALPELTHVYGFSVTIWGVPSDPSHNAQRGECLSDTGGTALLTNQNNEPIQTQQEAAQECTVSDLSTAPYLTMPTNCQVEPLLANIQADSWRNPGRVNPDGTLDLSDPSWIRAQSTMPAMAGCERLSFAPSFQAAPDTASADSPAGLTVEVKNLEEGLIDPEGLAPADIENTTVTLPEGFAINPGQAAGLSACQPAESAVGTEAAVECPASSKVGTVKVKVPLLEGEAENELEGNVYLLASNPPNLQLLLAPAGDGVHAKLIADVHLNETTGQVTTTLDGTPQIPFTDFKVSFSGGAQAALTTPTRCGDYQTADDFTPWSSPLGADFDSSSTFAMTSGPAGAPCVPTGAQLPFAPVMSAGSTTDRAGGYTDFSMLLQRGDGQQRIDELQFKAPAGLTGFLSHVLLCTNAQAESNACPEASKIGHTVVESGPGPYPLVIPEAGQAPAPIYLTEAYGGAPFGLSIVVPVQAGPFTLPTQRVRASIAIDPYTSQLTVTTNPLPQVIAGVPTDLREVDAVIERPEFMVNPTNCNPQSFSGTAYGTPPPGVGGSNASAAISTHFQVGSCQALKFEPKFSVSASGKNSKAGGARLTARLTYPSVPQGSDADIGSVKIELPKQLPSRLTTLQRACTAAQFNANPAACPSESKIGFATVHTPLLPVPLTGPVIFVSHGGESFPSLTVVLQGEGVTIDLVGATFISKAGITSTTFKTIPDDPFSTFELTLPQGKFSALAANVPNRAYYSLCGQKLEMPNEFVGQNGAAIKQSTRIAITGCAHSISISSHSVNKQTVRLSVYVPGAGKLGVSGKGVSSATKTAKGQETITVTLHQKNSEKLTTHIKLTYTSSNGKKQSKSLSVAFKK